MTESEYKEQSERLKQYKSAQEKIFNINKKKMEISSGIVSIQCVENGAVYFDENFSERLIKNIVALLNAEIETIKKSMENI